MTDYPGRDKDVTPNSPREIADRLGEISKRQFLQEADESPASGVESVGENKNFAAARAAIDKATRLP